MNMRITLNKIYVGDALELMNKIYSSSIDLVLTDLSYFLDKLGSKWNPSEVKKVTRGQAVKNLPAGMKFDPEQGKIYKICIL